MTNDIDRNIILACQKVAQGLIDGCECGGKGKIYAHCNRECGMPGHDMHADTCSIDVCDYVKPTIPCTCQPIRELVEHLEWILVNVPDLTLKLHITEDGTVWYLRHIMEVCGLWDEFRRVLWKHCIRERDKDNVKEGIRFANILTNGTYLRDAVWAFMEGVK